MRIYTRPVSRLSDLQFEVAADIADQLRLKLAGAEKRRPPRRYTENKEAYELYLKALRLFLPGTLRQTGFLPDNSIGIRISLSPTCG